MYAGMVASTYMYTYMNVKPLDSYPMFTYMHTCTYVRILLTWAKIALQLHMAPKYPLLLTEHYLHEGGPEIPA